MARERVTTNDLLDALRQYGKAMPKRPSGDGWQTLEELAAASGQTRAAVRYQIGMAKRRGLQFETATGSMMDAEGRMLRATFYRLKKP